MHPAVSAAMRAGTRAGIRNVIELAYRVGLQKDAKHPLLPYPTTAIGASDVNPLAMASTATFMNGGFRVAPRFANDVCRGGKSLLYIEEAGAAKDCDVKGENPRPQERVMHPAVAAAMTELLKSPLDIGPTGTAASLRTGVIPGMDPLGDAIWKLKPDERKKRMLAFPREQAGEIAGKTGTATNADGKTSDVWLLLFVPGPPANSEKGVVLGFWMGKDSKDHPLGSRGATGGPGFAESGARNWVHSAATVLTFLQKERGLLRPEHRFQPIIRDDVPVRFDEERSKRGPRESMAGAKGGALIEAPALHADGASESMGGFPRQARFRARIAEGSGHSRTLRWNYGASTAIPEYARLRQGAHVWGAVEGDRPANPGPQPPERFAWMHAATNACNSAGSIGLRTSSLTRAASSS